MSGVDRFDWQGRTDNEDGDDGLRWHQHISGTQISQADAVLLGFACDLGVANNKGRVGARQGPTAVKQALCNLAWHAPIQLADGGDIVAEDALDEAQTHFAHAVADQINNQRFVIGLGGGHEIAWASYQGIRQAIKGNIGIINIDAHFDLRSPSPAPSSGTPFYQIAKHCESNQQPFHYACIGIAETANTKALFDQANHTGTRYVLDKDCTFDTVTRSISPMLEDIDALYLTVCLDAFNGAAAPGVSAPSALGIDVAVVIKLIEWLGKEVRDRAIDWPLADIAEMNPDYDIDQRTAKLAARLVFEFLNARFSQ